MSTAALLALATVYMGVLFTVASLVDRSKRLVHSVGRKPFVQALALGTYATSWSIFGSVGFAATEGYRFLAIQIGATISCALMPVVWSPLAKLCRDRQLASVADLLAFRYDSRAIGALIAVFFLVGSLPYQALQLRAVVESVVVLGGATSRGLVAAMVTLMLVGFALLYGVRHLTPFTRHEGFVTALAVESTVKFVAHLAISGYAFYVVLGGISGLGEFLAAHPEATEALTTPARERSWLGILLLGGGAVFLVPRQWHIGFTEGSQAGLRVASWLLPCYLLVINLCVPFLLWAAHRLGLSGLPSFYVLGLSRSSGSSILCAIVFLGALSASSAMIVATTVALAGMLQTQVILPLTRLRGGNLYRRLYWLRRGLVTCIILAGYGMYLLLENGPPMAGLLSSLVSVAQVIPGLVGVSLWPRATARGVLFGLLAGITAWTATLVVPLLSDAGTLPSSWNWLSRLGVSDDPWSFTPVFALGVNAVVFVTGSLWSKPARDEQKAAAICGRRNELFSGEVVESASPGEFEDRLEPVLGKRAAGDEVRKALAQLALPWETRRPEDLRAVRDQLEKNLSGLLGPVTAAMIVDERLALDEPLRGLLSSQLQYVEERLSAMRLEGPALELEHARRFLRDVLDQLPVGVCALGPAGDVALWNRAMERITGLDASTAYGAPLRRLPAPWARALTDFECSLDSQREVRVELGGRAHFLSLHRAAIPASPELGGLVILIEDRTVERDLHAKVEHQNRLALIGRFAAGVAHEIGNPLVAIAALARNLEVTAGSAVVQGDLDLLRTEVKRIDHIIRELLAFARTGEHGNESDSDVAVPVADVVAVAVTITRLGRANRSVEVMTDFEPSLEVRGDPRRLGQVFVNLLTNACDASANEAKVRIEGVRSDSKVRIRVVDRGTGMTREVKERAFEPFFSTKGPGEGSGLGLWVAHDIVADHGGSIAIESVPGEGTILTVELPG